MVHKDQISRRNIQRGHFGKGPKGYSRSDASIREEVCEALTDDIWVDASDISVSVDHGWVKLEGKVVDRAQKKAAEACAEKILGVKDVLNYITLKEDHGLIGDANINLNMI
jgi:osmotically-inducible protein OsmY